MDKQLLRAMTAAGKAAKKAFKQHPCCRGGYAAGAGRIVGLACRSPRCPSCGPARAARTAAAMKAAPGYFVSVLLTFQDGKLPASGAEARSIWKRFQTALRRSLGDRLWRQLYILRAPEDGELTGRYHIHLSLKVPYGLRLDHLRRLFGKHWGAYESDGSVSGNGWTSVKVDARKGQSSYMCGYVTLFGKLTAGNISRSENLRELERQLVDQFRKIRGIVPHPPGTFTRIAAGILPWHDQYSRWQRRVSRELRAFARDNVWQKFSDLIAQIAAACPPAIPALV